MTVVVNGSERELHEGATVEDLLREMRLPTGRGVAVARNGDVVLRARWKATALEAGDRVEVLHAVQGG